MTKKQQPKPLSQEVADTVKRSRTWAELSRALKGNSKGSNVRTVKRYVAKYKLDTSHFNPRKYYRLATNKYTSDQAFIKDSPLPNTVLVRMYRKFYPAKECQECGIGTIWNGKPLTLQIDHRNGHSTDWRPENCRYLCPNCHYQTDTHGTKRGIKRLSAVKVTPKELSDAFDELGTYLAVGLKYGVSDRTVKNTVRKFRRDLAQSNK